MNLIQPTNIYFDPKYLNTDFSLRYLLAAKYKEGFNVVQEYEVCGNVMDPENTIPKELQTLFSHCKCMHIYTFVMEETLEWHIDSMKIDAISRGKYTALIYGSGILECKNKEGTVIEQYEFTEKYRLVKFAHTNLHRFIPHEKTKMVMVNTIAEDQPFDISLYQGTKVNGATYSQLENESEKEKLSHIRKEWYTKNNSSDI
jgi:hypothetical protein